MSLPASSHRRLWAAFPLTASLPPCPTPPPPTRRMASPVDPKEWTGRGKSVPPSFPLQVDEVAESVTVGAGITQRVLLDYLAEYKYWKQPSGWTLPAFSWCVRRPMLWACPQGELR